MEEGENMTKSLKNTDSD